MSKGRRNREKQPQLSRAKMSNRPSVESSVVEATWNAYQHPMRTAVLVIVKNAVVCGLAGVLITRAVTWLFDDKNDLTWVAYVTIAGGASVLQVLLAIGNSWFLVPKSISIGRTMSRDKMGKAMSDATAKSVNVRIDPPSRLGPACIIAAATVVGLMKEDAPVWAIYVFAGMFGAISPTVAHLTNHRDLTTLRPIFEWVLRLCSGGGDRKS